jgi:NRPS condensation-like uncharacterized protein
MNRKLTGSERSVWKRGAISLNIVIVAHIQGRIFRNELQRAWQILQKLHPLLGVHLEEKGDTEFLTSANTAIIPVREVIATTDTDWQLEALKELQTPFQNFSNAPFVRSVLMHSDKHCRLIISLHHCICDGLSATYLLRDILHCLSDQDDRVQQSADNLLMDNLIPSSVTLPFWQKAALKTVNLLFATRKPPKAGSVVEIPMKKSEILAWHISQEQTTSLLKASKKNKVTVHTAIATLFLAAQKIVQGSAKDYYEKMYTPISVRNLLSKNVDTAFGLYASESYVSYRYDTKKTFWQNGQDYQKELKRTLTDQKAFNSILMANALLPAILDRILLNLYRKQTIQFGYIISNLGNLSLAEHYGSLTLDGINGPIGYVQRAEKTLSVLTVNGKMHFTFTYQPEVLTSDTLLAIRNTAMSLLKKYSGETYQ